jgi:putative membrane protein
MVIPNWLRRYLKPETAEQIAAAIKDAESKTAGEIVPMIVRRSSTVGHVPVLLLTLLVMLFFASDGAGLQATVLGGHWLWFLVDVVVLIGIVALGARLPFVQRLLTNRTDQVAQVDARAVIEFYESDIHLTKDATGILIFVSLMERRAVVLADKAISEKVEKETWSTVCDRLVTGIKKKSLGVAIREAVLECGEIMAPHFPIQPDDENELKDRLIIKE